MGSTRRSRDANAGARPGTGRSSVPARRRWGLSAEEHPPADRSLHPVAGAGAATARNTRLRITGTSLDRDFQRDGSALPDGVSPAGVRRQGGAASPLRRRRRLSLPIHLRRVRAADHRGDGVRNAGGDLAHRVRARDRRAAAILVDPFAVESIESGLEQATKPDEAHRLRALGHERVRLFHGAPRRVRPSRPIGGLTG